MMGKSPRVNVAICFLCLFCATALAGCDTGTKALVGTYQAQTRNGRVTLQMKESGQGVWTVGEDQITFSWHLKGNQLRLYTRNGGVILGALKAGTIQIALPGLHELSFTKTR